MKGSVSRLIEQARTGDEPSLEQLFKRFYARLTHWAGRELDPRKCRAFDADDIAIDAFHSFYLGLTTNKFPDLDNRHGLQSLLATITIRKAINRIERANAQRRGAGKVVGESGFAEFDSFQSHGLTPDEQAILDDEIACHMDMLPENLRPIAQLLLLGYSTTEIAEEQNCSTRSIQIKRKKIAAILSGTAHDQGTANGRQ